MKNFKMGFVTIIGRPNTGKSTLLNSLAGQKIAVTTPTAQTTRRRIKAIYTDDKAQIVFLDTPGIHKPLNKLGEHLIDEAKDAIPDSDLTLFLVDGSSPIGKGDKWIIENILSQSKKIILVINKCDNEEFSEQNVQTYLEVLKDIICHISISALNNTNIDELLKIITENLPLGIPMYDKDVVTDETLRTLSQEVIREKVLLNTREEVPHNVAVLIDEYKEKPDIDVITATIYTNTESQKGILIGKNGSMIKKIGTEARLELQDIADKKVFLELRVKVQKDWFDNKKFI